MTLGFLVGIRPESTGGSHEAARAGRHGRGLSPPLGSPGSTFVTMLKSRSDRFDTFLFHEVYMRFGRKPKREFGNSVEVGYCEIAGVDYAHADQYVDAFTEFPYGDRDSNKVNTIR